MKILESGYGEYCDSSTRAVFTFFETEDALKKLMKMSSFKALNTKKFQKQAKTVTPDTIYWKRLGVPTLVKEFGAIDNIDFSPVEPYYFAATCSVRVQIYNPITKLVVKNISRFQQNAYGGTFRQDGRLLVAGDEEGFVKMFDTSSKSVLRFFRGHKAAVHRARFTSDQLHIASFSDDKSVKLWDIATEKSIHTFEEHSDYVRAGCVNPASSDIILSGGYDNVVKMYDTRTNQVSLSVNHESPVESLLFLPTGGIFLSAGGTEIKVWDAFTGGKLLARISQHHKTITALTLASHGRRFLSGGLDRHVKVYDVATYQSVHSFDFPNSVLSLGVSPNDHTLAVGMIDGLVSIQNMEKEAEKIETQKKIIPHSLSIYDQIVAPTVKPGEASYDTWLRKYEYSKALDVVLRNGVAKKTPNVTISVMQELIRRKGLARALAGRNHKSIGTIVQFINRHIGEVRFMRVLIDVANVLLDVYEDSFDQFTGDLGKLFIDLFKRIRNDVDLTYELLELQGAFELLAEAAAVGDTVDERIHFITEKSDLQTSERAKQASVVTLC